MRPWMEKWGSVLMILLCALVILFSALYTRQDDLKRLSAQNAAADQSETLADVNAMQYVAPTADNATQPYLGAYKSEAGLWQFDPFVRYRVQKGSKVFAVCNGRITLCSEETIIISGENSFVFRLRGAFSPLVKASDPVTAGQEIATVTLAGQLLLSLVIDGHYTDPLEFFTP